MERIGHAGGVANASSYNDGGDFSIPGKYATRPHDGMQFVAVEQNSSSAMEPDRR
ncbi:MAG TPA: hypothetical protein VJ651_01555 [Noviherbaspirillum sp.]|nr:hypothetical protein [Noviherbaspirillum sp.]